jgi:hypothetical protein
MEIINELELSHRFIASNNFSIPGGKSAELQKEIFDDDCIVTVLTIIMTFNELRANFVRTLECF